MSRKDTGRVLEQMILPTLERAGYGCATGVTVGLRLGTGRHVVDVVAERDGLRYLISLKWQQVAGTAEQKVPFEIICLSEALEGGDYAGAYLMLGGERWRFRDFFISDHIKAYMHVSDLIDIITLEALIAEVNSEGL